MHNWLQPLAITTAAEGKTSLASGVPEGKKCASTPIPSPSWRCVFVTGLQAPDASGEIPLRYDRLASGCDLYAYVGGDPVSRRDPLGQESMGPLGPEPGTTFPSGYEDPYAFGQTPRQVCENKCIAANPSCGYAASTAGFAVTEGVFGGACVLLGRGKPSPACLAAAAAGGGLVEAYLLAACSTAAAQCKARCERCEPY